MSLFDRVILGENLADHLAEGEFDPHQYRAVLMGGGMGSGKSFVNQQMFGSATGTATTETGVKSISVDDVFLYKAKKAGVDPQTVLHEPRGQEMHTASRAPSVKRQQMFAQQGLGLVIDGTGQDSKKIIATKAELEKLGYDVSMVMVKADENVALARNKKRGREVPKDLVLASRAKVDAAIPTYKAAFGDNYHEIENSASHSPEEVAQVIGPKLRAKGLEILSKPLKNPVGIAKLDEKAKKYPPHLARQIKKVKAGAKPKPPADVVSRVGRIKTPQGKPACGPGERMTFGTCRKVSREKLRKLG